MPYVIKYMSFSLDAFSLVAWDAFFWLPLVLAKPKQMGLIEQFSELPWNWILIITALLKLSLIVCLCGTDLCTSGEPTEYKRNEDNAEQRV